MSVDQAQRDEMRTPLSVEQARHIDLLCDDYECRRKQGGCPEISLFLGRTPAELHSFLREELAAVEVELCRRGGEAVEPEAIAERFGIAPGLVRSWLVPGREPDDERTPLPSGAPSSSAVRLLPPVPAEPDPDTQIEMPCRFGDYELLETLGEGGMGSVYRARHLRLGRQVALKLIRASVSRRREVVGRFQREMRAAGMLDHPNVVEAQHAGEHGGRLYLVMKLLDGLDLARLVARCGPLRPADAAEIIRQAALGLQALHERGLVHRDIKPSNLMLTREGVVKVLDLGLARLAAEEERGDLTGTGAGLGTLDYMAPEQQDDAAGVTIAADLYSLGCALHFLLTGSPPFANLPSPLARLAAHRREPVPSPQLQRPDLPAELLAVLSRLLAKTPQERYTEPRQVAEALAPLTAGARLRELICSPAAASATTPPLAPTTRWRRRRQPLWNPELVAVAVLLFLVGFATVRLLQHRLSGRPPEVTVESTLVPEAVTGAPVTIRSLHMKHYAPQGKGCQLMGEIGSQSFVVRFGDQVQLKAELSAPAYCYLLGLNANGKVQSIWPNRDSPPPQPRVRLVFPDVAQGMTLDDEPRGGVQAFVLLAMREPLPSRAEWHRDLPTLPWERLVMDRPAVWRGTEQELEEVYYDEGQRLHVSPLKGIRPLGDTIRRLRSAPEVEALAVLAFMVAPEAK